MRLNEIEYLRPILFVQLFFVHAFTIYTVTSWNIPVGVESVGSYDWIARLSNSCMLELFTFISGYVFYYVSQLKSISFSSLVQSKFKRLIVPSILFSILYYILLMDHVDFSLLLVYDVICGLGHLWYLPMLFACFLLSYYIKDTNMAFIFLIGAFILSCFSRCPNIFRASQIAYYFFFFYLGIIFSRFKNYIIPYCNRNIIFLFLSVALFLSLAVLVPINVSLKSYHTNTWLEGYFLAVLIRLINILYSSVGIVFWYYISIRLSKCILTVPNWIRQFNVLSMGIYIFHQFILMFLYYHTSLPEIFGSYFLPWVAIIIALPLSVFLSYLFRLSKVGKSLI